MYTARYYPSRYYPGRYYPKVGADPVVSADDTSGSSVHKQMQSTFRRHLAPESNSAFGASPWNFRTLLRGLRPAGA